MRLLLALALLCSPAARAEAPPVDGGDHTEEVAHDAYLGGSGVVGPLSLLGTTVNLIVEPALGAAASLMASEKTAGGSMRRSTVSAYAKTLTYMAIFVGMWVVSIPLWVGLLAVAPVSSGIGMYLALRDRPTAIPAAVGTALLVGGVGALMLSLLWGVPWFMGRHLGVRVGDRVWSALTSTDEGDEESRSDIEKLLQSSGSGPIKNIKAGVLLAAVAGGIWERNLGFDGIPVVGPYLTAMRANETLATRLSQARELGGMGALPDRARPLMLAATLVRSVLMSMAEGGFIVLAGLVFSTGAAVLAASLIPGLHPLTAYGILAGAVGLGAVIGVLTLASLAAGFLLNAIVPWILVGIAAAG